MRRVFLALPFALLPLAVAHAHEDHDHDHDHAHGSLAAHEHGVARLNVVLDGKALELELQSPAMNLVGFEHKASSEADKAKVAAVRAQLEKPLALFTLAKAAECSESAQALESPLFGDTPAATAADKHDHSEIHAHYTFACAKPEQLTGFDLSPLFKAFPATQKIQLQLIGLNGQQGIEATAANASIPF
ncbi:MULTISPECIES: DUF2796 domain-containing protein [Pseudomonas]|uniref:DUF2796 domain-containing protein n=1 Tax=Pseudomonas sp. Hg7Tf TaxID=3236988 RepID=A0AB39HXY0_9PSED|nr:MULTISPECIES: DUF2796 domain-containing protein [Pseudomonas]MDD1977908.1 DUF2796 domain-containing protein [Pseudomonas putida]MDH2561100.1 DUF2796 domain-containing protein [Pseudomonas sp. Hg5Tf]QYX46951.1 DUF2796 domain-containing protein [Pseudomonas sp. S11A 273]